MSAEAEKKKLIENLTCHHCGLPAVAGIRDGSNSFCCQGCLAASSLQDPESCRIQDAAYDANLSWTELPGALTDFEEGRLGEATLYRFRLPAIHCAACIQVLEKLHLRNPGIVYSEVLFLSREIRIAWNPAVTRASEVFQLLGMLGYAPDFPPA